MVAVCKFLRRTDVITYNFHTFKTFFNEIMDLIKKNLGTLLKKTESGAIYVDLICVYCTLEKTNI